MLCEVSQYMFKMSNVGRHTCCSPLLKS